MTTETSHPEFDRITTGEEVVAAFPDRVKGRIFVVTGPTPTGIGATTLTSLAKGHPAALVLAGRTPAKFQPVADAISAIDPTIAVVLVKLDLSSLASVRAAAKNILEHPHIPHIDGLINNAGLMATPFGLTEDGIETQFAACHVGHFLFTNLLLPKLQAAPEPVVVNVTSSGHRFGTGDFSDVNWEKTPYDAWRAYGHAKSANILFSVSLAERGIKSVAPHPGWVKTDIVQNMTDDLGLQLFNELGASGAIPNFEPLDFQKNLQQGCATTLVAALDCIVPNAAYMRDCQVARDVAPFAVDKSNAARLWELSNQLTGENFA
ncbi:putative short-chain dehydrogenase [Exidia glandulosa HHB12029]|uniref:Putative short-chain dehydrogenase n=1 Tax=Exidia glandulosa HHB12029 TaxID=1314781 RepID=A0A165ID13_EXIGL|nr:putative short-chain dehydrogenase [Exidia glandulosa HHB12029]